MKNLTGILARLGLLGSLGSLRLPILLLIPILLGCDPDPAVRRYREIQPENSASRMNATVNTSPVPIEVRWSAPPAWTGKPTSSLRVGSYDIPVEGGEALDLSVVKLSGDAGGLEANVVRWLGQAGIQLTSPELEQFMATADSFETASGQKGVIIDMTDLLSGNLTREDSIFGAIVMDEGYTVFVKATGQRLALREVRDQIREFSRSLNIQPST